MYEMIIIFIIFNIFKINQFSKLINVEQQFEQIKLF